MTALIESLNVVRKFDAPPPAAFDALTKPELLRRWMVADPATIYGMDVRPGGTWSTTSRRGEMEFVATGTYREAQRPQRLVYTFGMPQFSPNRDTIAIDPLRWARRACRGSGWCPSTTPSEVPARAVSRSAPGPEDASRRSGSAARPA
jgi:uncharacterized protein YndB with AHSA1/START domain